jgi:hypothetical protein
LFFTGNCARLWSRKVKSFSLAFCIFLLSVSVGPLYLHYFVPEI